MGEEWGVGIRYSVKATREHVADVLRGVARALEENWAEEYWDEWTPKDREPFDPEAQLHYLYEQEWYMSEGWPAAADERGSAGSFSSPSISILYSPLSSHVVSMGVVEGEAGFLSAWISGSFSALNVHRRFRPTIGKDGPPITKRAVDLADAEAYAAFREEEGRWVDWQRSLPDEDLWRLNKGFLYNIARHAANAVRDDAVDVTFSPDLLPTLDEMKAAWERFDADPTPTSAPGRRGRAR